MAAARKVSIDAAVELDNSFTLKEKNKTQLKAFLAGQKCFALVPTGFGRRSVKHCGA